jgi:hypothetical protein
VIKTLATSYRGDTAGSITLALLRQHFTTVATDSVANLAGLDTAGNNRVRSITSSAIYSTVDNRNYSYSLELCMSTPSDVFYAGRVGYQYMNAGD